MIDIFSQSSRTNLSNIKLILRTVKGLFDNNIRHKPTPLFLYLKVTTKCNARCWFCNAYNRPAINELSRDELFDVIDQATVLGCTVLCATGGEPLVRKDLPKIFEYAQSKDMWIQLYTNGYYLQKRIPEIGRFTDSLLVSLDFPDKRHDKLRGLKGSFDRAIEGIKASKEYVSLTMINCVINQTNLADLEKMVLLAQSLDVSITFGPLQEHYYLPDAVRIKDPDILSTKIDRLIEMKKEGYPILDSIKFLEFIKEPVRFSCYTNRIMLPIDWEGKIEYMCPLLYETRAGDLRKKPLRNLWFSKRLEKFRRFTPTCNNYRKCGDNAVVELSQLSNLSPIIALGFMRDFIKFRNSNKSRGS
ncbi:MAG: radical SAM/SPASM domain-containing protein [Candidatus Heimdallarchaeota archaeon]